MSFDPQKKTGLTTVCQLLRDIWCTARDRERCAGIARQALVAAEKMTARRDWYRRRYGVGTGDREMCGLIGQVSEVETPGERRDLAAQAFVLAKAMDQELRQHRARFDEEMIRDA